MINDKLTVENEGILPGIWSENPPIFSLKDFRKIKAHNLKPCNSIVF
jgi:hypothetical protein